MGVRNVTATDRLRDSKTSVRCAVSCPQTLPPITAQRVLLSCHPRPPEFGKPPFQTYTPSSSLYIPSPTHSPPPPLKTRFSDLVYVLLSPHGGVSNLCPCSRQGQPATQPHPRKPQHVVLLIIPGLAEPRPFYFKRTCQDLDLPWFVSSQKDWGLALRSFLRERPQSPRHTLETLLKCGKFFSL